MYYKIANSEQKPIIFEKLNRNCELLLLASNLFIMNKLRRPDFLSALCILTFIGSSFTFAIYLLASLFFKRASEIIVEYSAWHSTNDITPLYFTILMVLSALSLTGAIRMWKLYRDGFFIYTVAQILLIIIPIFWVNSQTLSTVNLIFTFIFIGGYALNFLRNK